MTPLEHAARALYREQDGQSEAALAKTSPEDRVEELDYAEDAWRCYIPEVRAVLTAIREPSELMLAAAAYAMPGVLKEQIKANEDAAFRLWRKMIDAALAEGE